MFCGRRRSHKHNDRDIDRRHSDTWPCLDIDANRLRTRSHLQRCNHTVYFAQMQQTEKEREKQEKTQQNNALNTGGARNLKLGQRVGARARAQKH